MTRIEYDSHEIIIVTLIAIVALGFPFVFSPGRFRCYRYPSFTEISRAADFITGTRACIRSFGMNGRVADSEMPATISPLPSRIGAATHRMSDRLVILLLDLDWGKSDILPWVAISGASGSNHFQCN
ncbi:hypothetical protein QFE97_12025 [Bacillus subtilis]|nr:hypothetical protein QFE97_12025 [Bacillus subtilis]